MSAAKLTPSQQIYVGLAAKFHSAGVGRAALAAVLAMPENAPSAEVRATALGAAQIHLGHLLGIISDLSGGGAS